MNPDHSRRKGLSVAVGTLAALVSVLTVLAASCGGTGGLSSPKFPNVVISFSNFLVDVGQRFQLDGSSSTDPNGRGLDFAWSFVNPDSQSSFDDRCLAVPAEICSSNDDDPCSVSASIFCANNADCPLGELCLVNTGTTSSDCSTGRCEIGLGSQREQASFLADVAGPYSTRLTADDGSASATTVTVLDTYPSLFLVGSLRAFGGTLGGDLGEFGDGPTFANGATAGASNPADGNLIVIVPTGSGGVVREFDLHTGRVLGTFGETASAVSDPQALAFDSNGDLYVADGDGTVSVFQGEGAGKGLFLSVFGDVTGAGQNVAAMAFSPVNGDLLVVDGAAGQGIREYSAADGSLIGVLGQTATAVAQAVDLAFLPSYVCRHDGATSCNLDADCEALDPTSKCVAGAPATLLIADKAGDVIACDTVGNGCASFGNAAASLSAGGPTAVAVNPSGGATGAKVLISDAAVGAVVGCDADAMSCSAFGQTSGVASAFRDVFYAPPTTPTTTSTTSTTFATTTTTVP